LKVDGVAKYWFLPLTALSMFVYIEHGLFILPMVVLFSKYSLE